jgi:hypothetical protein
MYVSNFLRVQKHALPDTRTRFYDEVTKELLIRRRQQQLGNRRAQIAAVKQRSTIFGIVALDNMLDPQQPTNSLSWERAIEVVRQVTGVTDKDIADQMLADLATETGLIVQERRGDRFRFLHKSFCEFFAAREAALGSDATNWHLIVASHREFCVIGGPAASRLIDTIPFMIAMLPTRDQLADAFVDISELKDWPLVGRCLLETQAYEKDIWPDYAKYERDYLVSVAERDWDHTWIERLHLFQNVVDGAAQAAEMNVSPRNPVSVDLYSLFSQLVGESRRRLITMFTSYARERILRIVTSRGGWGGSCR